MLTKEQILSAEDIVKEIIDVPEWGGEIIVTTITAAERDRWEQELSGIGKKTVVENFRARLIALCIINDDGKRVFEKSDVVLLGKKSAKVMDRIFEVCQRLNGISQQEVDELEKNSEETSED